MPKITITLTQEQAAVVKDAVDLMHRLRLGQIDELRNVWPERIPGKNNPHDSGWQRLSELRARLDGLKQFIFPEFAMSGASYGVGSKELTKNDNRLYEIYKVLDRALWEADGRKNPGLSVNSDDPYLLRYSGDAKIPYKVEA